MIRADGAEVSWDAQKKQWLVRIRRGEEVIRRPMPKTSSDAADDVLRSKAVETASDDGYAVDPSVVTIRR
ncbi:MAG: hypothetical protein HY238_14120 [Acidobacteria bacterium]|nr:hypothetical protein [Acidobacteriota bacterium]